VKFLCEQCKAKYQIADDKVVGKTVRMKCRKCGHLIEVRAAITESSVASLPPAAPAGTSPSGHPRPAARQPPPRSTPLAASLAATRPPASKPERLPGALAGAFKSTVQREEEISAPFDMSELSPGDDWYVAVNGVPVGPIRVAEVRRKASLGAVTEDSLVWQEGLDEWRPLRSFPELAAIVREAATTGRSSITPPPPDVRGSVMPPQRATSLRPSVPTAQPSVSPRFASPRITPAVTAAAARSNVVPITSRLATAERLDEPLPNPFAMRAAALASQPVDAQPPLAAPGADAMHFAPAVAPVAASPVTAVAPASIRPRSSSKKGPPWIILGMVAMFIAFGITAAILVVPTLTHPEAQTPAPSSSAVAPAAPPATATAAPTGADTVVVPVAVASAPPTRATGGSPRVGGGGNAAPAVAAATTAAGKGLDLSGLTGGPRVAPTDELGSDGTRAPGQCFSEGQVAQTIGLHQAAIRRTCWERNPSQKLSTNVSVALTIANDGSTQNVTASGDDPTVAHCIENDVRNWRFPAMGCSQKISVPFKFVRQ
jgi:predicted Zn finger-like uncharacterized protein